MGEKAAVRLLRLAFFLRSFASLMAPTQRCRSLCALLSDNRMRFATEEALHLVLKFRRRGERDDRITVGIRQGEGPLSRGPLK